MIEELRKYKIKNYEFIDAVDKDNQVVEDAYQNGLVKLFPPCFRCGRIDCNCENNVLIPTQVATFFSHVNVWKIIAEQEKGVFLIVEDDIKFNWYYSLMKPFIYMKVNKYIKENKNNPLLIRLAWAHNDEHKLQKFKFVSGLVKMSNPMYAINPCMAKTLLKEFKIIATTVDIFVHKEVGPKYANYTLMPPIAHELSYSFGAVESLIRPRSKRIERLEKNNELNGADNKELVSYDNHIDRAVFKKLLAIGHQDTGSEYISVLLKAYGLDIENEAMGAGGIVSWMFTVFDLNNPYYLNKYAKSRYYSAFKNIIMFARDPLTAIPSIICDNNSSDASYNFRVKHIYKHFNVNLNDLEDDLERAIESYYLWTKLAMANNPELIIRIEQDEDVLKEYLEDNGFELNADSHSDVVKRIKLYRVIASESAQLNNSEWMKLGDTWRDKLNELCAMLNYKPIYDEKLSVVIR